MKKTLFRQNGVKLNDLKEQLKKLRGPAKPNPVIALKTQTENDIATNRLRITQ